MNAEKKNTPAPPSSRSKAHLLAQHLPTLICEEGEEYDPAMQKRLKQEAVRDHQDNTVTGLVKFWSAAKHHVRKGVIPDADLSYVDYIVDYPGFGQAMQKVGWIKYDKKKNCLLIPAMKREQLKAEAKKAQAALRQKRHRRKLKVRHWIIEGRKAAAELANCSRFKNEKAVINNDVAYDEQGRMTRLGSVIINGKEMQVFFSSPRHRVTDRHSSPAGASNETVGGSAVIPNIAECVTVVASNVTESVTHRAKGITQDVATSVTHGASGATSSVAKSVTLSNSGVTPGIAECVKVGDSCVTPDDAKIVTVGGSHVTPSVAESVTEDDSRVPQSAMKSVTHGDSDVTSGIAESVTHWDSGVTSSATECVTVGDSGITQNVTDYAPRRLSRVIPSRAHTRFSFLRSKTLRSKHKTTHSAHEKFFKAAMRFKIKTAQGQNPTWPERSGHPKQNPVVLSEPRNYLHPFDAQLNVTQSFTLWRNGQSATCVTRKIRHAELTPLPEKAVSEPGKFRLFSDWSPSADFLANAQYIGLTLSHEATDLEVAEFINYWSEEGAQHTQKQWETKLARFIGKGRKRAAKRAQSRQDFTIPTSMDYAIPDGFHGG
ncbi:DnaT-like ssDNA-binding domain-containing protein [Pantoea sp. EA-12]|uniref:DnaT-like ssDNA-binding domain-containing protein n=1 Tax=Pantoea sp. EA-12 TaxID=3043303 RepID=UPI0024B60609|nr:DnaT-like ssDNA-binding domain-containing protein [Pantoea sp. EA-12]MDI9222097.1 DnaT-like ssDNA-binding domain-containing protein [Pantoea sp. EA-12]